MAEAARIRAGIAEGQIAWIRLGIIAFNVLVYALWLPHGRYHGMAAAVCIIALSYAVAVVLLRPHERLPVMQTASFTMAGDSVLIATWLFATGGLASPFGALWLLSLVAIVFRFGPRVVMGAAGLYASADLLMLAVAGDLVASPVDALVRVAYIIAVGALGALLTAAWSRAVEDKVEMASAVLDHQHEVAENRRLRAFSDAAFEALLIHRNGIVIEANQAAGQLFGRPIDQLIGSHAKDLVASASKDLVLDRIANPEASAYELWLDRRGERRRVAVQGRDIEFHGETVRVVALRDVTQEYEARQARELAAEQEAEIRRLHELDRFRRRFVNTAAHELNTPLTPIRLQLMLLRRRFGDEGFAILQRNVDRLGGLVQDLLDAAKLEDHKLRLLRGPGDVALVAREAAETFELPAMERGVQLHVDADEAAWADIDKSRLTQVLQNLLSNALKFTPSGGSVSVKVRSGEGVVIRVQDTGPGIADADRERLFQPFSMLHEDPAVPGTGLGLYICRHLVEAMDGKITLEDGPGARFRIDLPVLATVTA